MTNSNLKIIPNINLITHLMSGYGDCSDPLSESAEMILGILKEQMNSLLIQLTDIAKLRDGDKIDYRDVIFLIQNNRGKLRSLLKYIILKEQHFNSLNDNRTMKTDNITLSENTPQKQENGEEPVNKKQKKSENCHETHTDLLQDKEVKNVQNPAELEENCASNCDESAADCDESQTKTKKCVEFLNFISGTSQLNEIVEDVYAEIEQEKDADLKEQSSSSSGNCRFLAYQEARQAMFIISDFQEPEFKQWLYQGEVTSLGLTDFAFEMIGYLAQQTIATIVEDCLLVKRDKKTCILERLEAPTIACNTAFSSYRHSSDIFLNKSIFPKNKYFECSAMQFCATLLKRKSQVKGKNVNAITPNDIMEVLFRFYQSRNVFGEKSACEKKKQLFCC